jgi:hypothetical protein
MRRFVTLVVLLLFSIPFGVSISGCSKYVAPTFCNGGDSGITTGQASEITILPKIYGYSLNYAEIGQIGTPSTVDCKGNNVSVVSYTYSTSDMTIADVEPSNGRLCGGTWNRNTGGGIPDYTVCNPTGKSGIAYVAASADGVVSNPLPVFIHPVVTSIVLGSPAPASTATITAWSIANNVPTFTAQNTFTAGQTLSLSNFPISTFFNGIGNAVVQAAGLSTSQFSVAIPGFTEPNGSSTETGLAIGPGCTTDPTTACCPLATTAVVTAPVYQVNSCQSQGTQSQLVARVFAGAGANQVPITCQVGHLQYSTQGSTSLTSISPVVSVDQNGVATANLPGSVLITTNISNAVSSAGYFSTCPPASIALSATGQAANPVPVNLNNTQPMSATILDTNGVSLTGLSLEYVSTAPTTMSVSSFGGVTPSFAGAGSVHAICQPSGCNQSSYSQIGLFGNGTPVISNSVNFTTPGTNSTVLFMASTQSLDVVTQDFTSNVIGQPFLLPYVPNSMVISTDGNTIYMGSSSGLMVLNALNSLSLSRTDVTSPGMVLAVSPDDNTVVLTDPVRGTVTLESSTGGVLTTFGGVGTHAEWAPDSQTVYITTGTVTTPATATTPAVIAPASQVLIFSVNTGWTEVTNSVPASDVAITVPSSGAYFAGSTTTARGFCPISTPSTANGVTSDANQFYPTADSASVATNRISATNNGLHILGAVVTSNPPPNAMLQDLLVTIPTGACPLPLGGIPGTFTNPSPGLKFADTPTTTVLSPVTATAITGVIPTSDSSLAIVTYTGTGGVLPAYAPAASGQGTTTYIKLSGSAIAPVVGAASTDNTTLFVGTTGDNLVHLIDRANLTDCAQLPAGSCLGSATTLSPKLIGPTGTIVPVNLMVQKPRKTT